VARGSTVNIADFLTSINRFDLLIILILFGAFILGFIQGTIRRLLGIASILFSFLLAANLQGPLGDFLAKNWTQFAPEYAVMVGFGTVFVAASVAFTLVIQAFYTKVPLFERYTFIDEVLGGLLGVVQGLLILGAMIVILDSFFTLPIAPRDTELPLLRDIFNAYDNSGTATLFRDALIPAFLAVFGFIVPANIKALYS
jgi:membrane protein required for colicin V production